MDTNVKFKLPLIICFTCCVIFSEANRTNISFNNSSSLDTSVGRYEQEIVKDNLKKEPSKFITALSGVDHTHKKNETVESRAVKNDPWQGYYDFLINEGSFKFWAVFQVATALILIYSALAAVYYAKYNFIQPDYDYGDYFFGRSDSESSSILSDQNSHIFQKIMDAIYSQKYN